MTLSSAIIPIFTHFLPILYFVFMMMDVLLRNYNRIEHRLVFGIITCCMLMFSEEFVRHYLPIEYSPLISVVWFSTAGILITGFGLHLFIKLTQLEHKMPRYIFPYFCYFPVVIVLINLIFNDQMISGNEFNQVGIWKLPVYNAAYYIAMIGSNFFNVIYVIILARGKKNASTSELREVFRQLILGVTVTAFFNLVIGLIDFKGYMPPYPYIYGAFAWCLLLRHTMVKYDFLNHIDKRYEKLFNLNPAAIMLMDLHGNVKEVNPSARKLFEQLNLDHVDSTHFLNAELQRRIADRKEISNFEVSIINGDNHIDVIIDGDYVLVEYESHLILIVRDITVQMENQREITFLAYHDVLTRLPNRRLFFEQLDVALVNASHNRQQLAVVMFDLDNFKLINDKYGHQIGDRVLVHVADVIRKVIESEGVAARLGGDEFIFFLHPVYSIQSIKEKINLLQQYLQDHKFIVENEPIPIHLSIGVSCYPDQGLDGDTLLNSADKALYQIKRKGGNGYLLVNKEGVAFSNG
ncbi:MAG: sensor domain-containing diguanylate cyclase [Candidatus Cohnella colombiensis]|uniref:Sensor domain-containing diguanylate cyclase n=1 Tax=Candidatus Cohnella colombiensis TaxID=3121368 RepID=A0AA95EZG7_9BACL|nr:MAG: sensor domain-containing diguanylate cyclase [Cohnella sp.]